MKRSQVYLEAAKLVANRDADLYSCDAICCASYPLSSWRDLRLEYADLFRPSVGFALYWLDYDLPKWERKDWRVLALCFMAAIAEDEERAQRRKK